MSEKRPKNVEKCSEKVENTILGHVLDSFCLFGPCLCLAISSNACPLQIYWHKVVMSPNWSLNRKVDFSGTLTLVSRPRRSCPWTCKPKASGKADSSWLATCKSDLLRTNLFSWAFLNAHWLERRITLQRPQNHLKQKSPKSRSIVDYLEMLKNRPEIDEQLVCGGEKPTVQMILVTYFHDFQEALLLTTSVWLWFFVVLLPLEGNLPHNRWHMWAMPLQVSFDFDRCWSFSPPLSCHLYCPLPVTSSWSPKHNLHKCNLRRCVKKTTMKMVQGLLSRRFTHFIWMFAGYRTPTLAYTAWKNDHMLLQRDSNAMLWAIYRSPNNLPWGSARRHECPRALHEGRSARVVYQDLA